MSHRSGNETNFVTSDSIGLDRFVGVTSTFAGEEGMSDEKNLFTGDESDLAYAGAVLVAVDAGLGANPYWMKLYQVV